jgi:hypothetical protein
METASTGGRTCQHLVEARRVVRYEAELAVAAVATTELDLEEHAEIGDGKPPDPEDAGLDAERASLIIETLENLRETRSLAIRTAEWGVTPIRG